ncbi:MAG TPA: homoserine O-acetyltransferase [Sedimentisphaerales bacterium]|nr:homoserine O-acetyltransferase [Sedimentisphaerales bacterium]HRS12232.1 homoserine O-acetyltransferase [Sedimentisphaerales bacterium]HRV48821.1 homoserine O-acetyltransferase [Sedimentisphaerales bacterium]
MTAIDANSVGLVQTRVLRVVESDAPLLLECGKKLGPIDVAYETYGQLNEAGDNAILVCHALSGSAHAAGYHSLDDRKPGWWEDMIGPGKGIDTNTYFVLCSNFLGGCSGTTGPSSINPQTGQPYGLSFPIITIADMVRVQKLLLDRLGIKHLLAVIGGSIGGMQVLQWSIAYPDMMDAAIPIATTTHLGAQSIAFDAVGRNAILADANFADGQYYDRSVPGRGLAIARMIGHITYLSEEGMRQKFGRELRSADKYSYDFNSEFSVETYLDYQGQTFVDRFDANSYLYITKASDYFDLTRDYGSLARAFANTRARFLVVSFSSDWLFTPGQSEAIVDALATNGKDVSFCNIESSYGHDAFLLENETLGAFVRCFLAATSRPERVEVDDLCCRERKHRRGQHEEAHRVRVDYQLVESLIEPDATVLDVGCGDGELLARLRHDKQIDGRGIELEQDLVLGCVCKRLSIIQYDIERGLGSYADKSFDYAILSQTIQTIRDPERVLRDLLRVGRRVIVSFPNFAHWRSRVQLLCRGKAPVTRHLPFGWHNTPNIHCLSLKDFEEFCEHLGAWIERRVPLVKTRPSPVRVWPNLLAEQVIYVIRKD